MQRENTNRLRFENNEEYCLRAVGQYERYHVDDVVTLQEGKETAKEKDRQTDNHF